jgi:hypothetical protein
MTAVEKPWMVTDPSENMLAREAFAMLSEAMRYARTQSLAFPRPFHIRRTDKSRPCPLPFFPKDEYWYASAGVIFDHLNVNLDNNGIAGSAENF